MVTRLTNYTKQRYVRNSTDDPGDIVFRNGDTVFLMDTQQEIIYSEEDNQWYPVPTGGGSTLITKIITANGTYSASSDNADGYSSVTVNVAGAPPENISVLFKNHNDSSGTIAIGAEMYNATYGVILGQPTTSVSIGSTTTKTTAKQGNHIVATVNVPINSVYYDGNQLPASFTGSSNTRFAIIELPSNYDNTIPIELKR